MHDVLVHGGSRNRRKPNSTTYIIVSQKRDEDGVEIDKSAPARRAFPMLTGKLKRY